RFAPAQRPPGARAIESGQSVTPSTRQRASGIAAGDWPTYSLERTRDMEITRDTLVSELAAHEPATVKVFQKHQIDFCCGGKIPLEDACEQHGLSFEELASELASASPGDAWQPANWQEASLT